MLIRDGEDYLEIVPVERTPAGVPGAGDTCFSTRVRSGSFSAETRAYIEADDIRAFAEELRRIDERRQGAVVVESMSPDELRLEIHITDQAGHVAALGQVGGWGFSRVGGRCWSVVCFYVTFCPSLLPAITREFEELAKSR
jgi:hypothetical protein